MTPPINLLEYLRSRSQIDIDSQDSQISIEFGPFIDCTSNQADDYYEFLNPDRAQLLQDAVVVARSFHCDFPDISFEELAVEVAMIKVSLSIVPFITGTIHVMANPVYSYSMGKLLKNGQRISALCRRLEASFDQSRLCVKVPATWEGLLACRKLKNLGINTLATTVFTMEQSILAAEAGCVYIAPFVHELKALFEEDYDDTDPIVGLCLEAQRFFERHNLATRVKAAGLAFAAEAKELAGCASITLAPPLVRELAGTVEDFEKVERCSLFREGGAVGVVCERQTFVNDEAGWRKAFAEREGGKGKWKTEQAIDIFSDYQCKAETLIKDLVTKGVRIS